MPAVQQFDRLLPACFGAMDLGAGDVGSNQLQNRIVSVVPTSETLDWVVDEFDVALQGPRLNHSGNVPGLCG